MMVPGNKVVIDVAAKGGSEQVEVQDDEPVGLIVDWVLEMVPQMGATARWDAGIGIGGTAEAMLLAKQSLMDRSTRPSCCARAVEPDRGTAHRAL